MRRKNKVINKSPYPDHVIETIARCLWPDIQKAFESEKEQHDFTEWKESQDMKIENAYAIATQV